MQRQASFLFKRGLLNSFKAFVAQDGSNFGKVRFSFDWTHFLRNDLCSVSHSFKLFSELLNQPTMAPFASSTESCRLLQLKIWLGIDKTGQLTQNRRFSSNSGRFKLRHVFETDHLDKVATPKLTPTSCLPRKVLGIFFPSSTLETSATCSMVSVCAINQLM